MLNIPEKFVPGVEKILQWHLGAYLPEFEFNLRLERILEHFYKRNLVDGMVQIEEKELYFIRECVGDATNNVSECGVEKSDVWEIWSWVSAEHQKHKDQI